VPSDELVDLLQQEGRDPSRLIFEDELTGIHNRRFLLGYLNHKVRWKSGEDFPVSLLMMDVDHFKRINDAHGHDAGDQVLIWLADILWSEAAGQKALPVRYAGDEFMMLVLGASPADARRMAERIFERIGDSPVELADGATLTPEISIGIATAPGDARAPPELIHSADAALYYAKRSGRNRAAAASEIEPDKVFAPTALKRLQDIPVAGRQSELRLIGDAVEALGAGKAQFLLFEGAPGMGKTTLLDAAQRSLSPGSTTLAARVAGAEQEAFRPYYLAARVFVGLLGEREDRGASVLESIPPHERSLLSRGLPARSGDDAPLELPDSDDPAEREAIFNTLAALLPRVTDGRPLLLLIDDLQFADEATLLLLRVLLRRPGLPLVVCATCMESTLRAGNESPPLDAFYEEQAEEIGIRKFRLRALTADAIASHLGSVFPGVELPAGLEEQLAHVTQGNPLFLVEILRKLVADGKIAPGGQGWRMASIEDGYLPRSLEEIVSAKIAALDDERRELLEQATALGETTTLSMLSGTSDTTEARVLDFLDQAQALGLVSLDFHLNDETLRFLGKRVLEISYGSIEEARREELHERVGSYQEGLYQHILGPSASILAYHFKRSANREKAARYERLRLDYSRSVFNRSEAASYTGEARADDDDRAPPSLAPGSLQLIPEVLRTFMTALRNVRLYPSESDAIQSAQRALWMALDRILADNETLVLSQENRMLHANDQRVDISEARLMTASFLQMLSRVDLQAVSFQRGFTEDELRSLIRAINAVRPEVLDRGYWRRFSREHAMRGIGLKQLGFARVARRDQAGAAAPPAPAAAEGRLTRDDWQELPGALRALLGAMRAIRLYPVGSRPVSDAVAQLEEAMRGMLQRHGALTLAAVQGDLLINGVRSIPAELAPLAARLRQQLESVHLESLGFHTGAGTEEIETAIGALRQLPPELDRSFWSTFARAHGLEKVAFNAAAYSLEVDSAGPPATGDATAEEAAPAPQEESRVTGSTAETGAAPSEPAPPAAETWSDRSVASLVDELPELGKDLLVRGAHERLHTLLEKVFTGYGERETGARERVVAAFARLLYSLMPAQQNRLTRLSLEPVLAALSEESEPRVLLPFAQFLHCMAASALPFSHHAVAARIYTSLTMRQLELELDQPRQPAVERRLLEPKLDPNVQLLLKADLQSSDPERQERAADVLGSLGHLAVPLLVDVIKEEKQLRIGLLAASILAGLGPEAEAEIKRQMVLEVTIEQRFRIIELVDQVTKDVIEELAVCIGDPNPKIRRAAYRLAERLRDERVVDVLIEHARADDIGPAKGALRSLGALGTEDAVAGLVRILEARPEDEWAIACAQALGQTAHPDAIEALARLLGERKHLVFGRRWSDQVRSTAAFALARFDDVRAREALADHARDADSRVRRAAAHAAASAPVPDEEPAESPDEPEDDLREAGAAEPEEPTPES